MNLNSRIIEKIKQIMTKVGDKMLKEINLEQISNKIQITCKKIRGQGEEIIINPFSNITNGKDRK
jgi:hypothetical protein